jgi:hypothetical protein
MEATMAFVRLRCRLLAGHHVDQLTKQVAELALRLAALPADGLRNDIEALNSIEQLAILILKEVAAVRAAKSHPVGESRGLWPAMRRQ